MRPLTLCLSLALSAVAFAADEKKEKPPELVGKYDCKGDGYKGTVTITADGPGYKVDWEVGKEKYSGIGIWENDRLSVGWQTAKGDALGVIVYQREKDGTLKGKWTSFGASALSEESLTPLKK